MLSNRRDCCRKNYSDLISAYLITAPNLTGVLYKFFHYLLPLNEFKKIPIIKMTKWLSLVSRWGFLQEELGDFRSGRLMIFIGLLMVER